MKLENYIIGIMGRKGSGKTEFLKKAIGNIDRYIIVDTLKEYEKGVIFDSVYQLKNFIDLHGVNNQFHVIFRPLNDESMEYFLTTCLTRIQNYTLILEEVDYWCNSYFIHPVLKNMIRYGRHFNKNMLWISRCPYEINRFLTRNCDLIVTFVQTEDRDLKYLNTLSFNKNVATLKEWEYSYWIQNPKEAEKLLGLFDEKYN